MSSQLKKVKEIKDSEEFSLNAFVGEGNLLCTQGMSLHTDEIALLEKWKIETIQLSDYLESERKFIHAFIENYSEYKKVLRNFTKDLEHFYNSISEEHKIVFPNFDEHFLKIYEIFDTPTNYIVFYIHTKIKGKNYEQVAILTAFYSVFIAMRLNLAKSEIRKCFYISILIDLGFLRRSEESFLRKDKEKKISRENFDFLNFHIQYGLNIAKEIENIPRDYLYYILTHHEYLDGSGLNKISGEKIKLISKIVTVAHEYVYVTSSFLQNCFPPLRLANGLIFLLRHKNRYDSEVLKAFISVMSFFPPGEILLLENNRYAVSIKPNRRDPLKPLVEVVSNANRSLLRETETVNLIEENIQVSGLIDDEKLRKNIINSIYRRI